MSDQGRAGLRASHEGMGRMTHGILPDLAGQVVKGVAGRTIPGGEPCAAFGCLSCAGRTGVPAALPWSPIGEAGSSA